MPAQSTTTRDTTTRRAPRSPGGSGATEYCNCSFQFAFWADDGTAWNGRVYGWDSEVTVGSGEGYNTKTTHTITQTAALGIAGALPFGTLKIGDTIDCGSCSGNVCDIPINNTGNHMIDVQVSTAGAAQNFTCSSMSGGAVNLNIDKMKYDSTDATAYASCASTMHPAAGSTNAELSSTFDDPDVADDFVLGENTKYIYWGIQIPVGTMGSCTLSVNAAATASA